MTIPEKEMALEAAWRASVAEGIALLLAWSVPGATPSFNETMTVTGRLMEIGRRYQKIAASLEGRADVVGTEEGG